MTLNTLKGMNMSFNDLADSLKAKPQPAAPVEPARPKYSFTQAAPEQAEPEVEDEVAHEAEPEAPKASKSRSKKAATTGVDPAHWWGALTDQFQHIATHAMNDMTHRAQAHASAEAAKSVAKKPATKAAPRKTAAKAPAAKTSTAKKPVARKTAARKR
jgi:hypothetical protein